MTGRGRGVGRGPRWREEVDFVALGEAAFAALVRAALEHLGFVLGDGVVGRVVLGEACFVRGGHPIGAGAPLRVVSLCCPRLA
jgi:hypothetical protein